MLRKILNTIYFLMGFALLMGTHISVRAETTTKADTSVTRNLKPYVLNGFRSASFGQTQQQVYDAIKKDFALNKNQVRVDRKTTEKNTVFSIVVKGFEPFNQDATILYTFGYKSKRLIRVDVALVSKSEVSNIRTFLENTLLFRDYYAQFDLSGYKVARNAVVDNGLLLWALISEKTDKKSGLQITVMNISATQDKDTKHIVIAPLDDPKAKGTNKKLPVEFKMVYVSDLQQYDVFKLKDNDF